MTLRSRLARIESGRNRRPPGRFGVFRARPGESVEQAATRAGAYVGALIVPHALDRDAWEQAATEQQARAVAEQGRFIAEHRIEPDAPPVVRRRTESEGTPPAPKPEPRKSATVRLTRR